MARGTVVICLYFLFASAMAQDNVLAGHKMATPPTIDGMVNDAEWAGVPSGQGAFDADNGAPAVEAMQFWLAYDESYIYFAAKLADSQPATIKANEYRTNVSLRGDDNVKLFVDLSGSLADFNGFGINPKGATEIQLAGGRAAKREWSGEFIAQGRITAEGWEVEARIPWKIMRLPGPGVRNLRFNIQRDLQRTQRSYAWQYTGGGQPERTGTWSNVELPKAPVDRTIRFLPFGYAGYDGDKGIFDGGLDLKTNLADQVVFVGSVNPDFRNIENAILSLDFSRFERLAGETRPFFQEGSQYYNSALFASQRIRDFDFGANVYGRMGDNMSFGVLDTYDTDGTNNLVTNFTYDPTPNDSFRVTATNTNLGGFDNLAYLVRYSRNIGAFNVFLRNMTTRDSDLTTGLYNTALLFYGQGGFQGVVQYDAVSPDFLPRLGFAPEVDFKGPSTFFQWTRPWSHGTVREFAIASSWADYNRYDGGHYRNTIDNQASIALANGLGIGFSSHHEDFLGTKDHLYGISARMPRGDPYRFYGAAFNWGRLADQDFTGFTVAAGYKPTQQIQLIGSYQFVDHFDRGDLGILGFNYDLGRDTYVSGRLVKRSDDWGGYLSLRRSGNRGSEYFLILGDPNAQTFRTSLILKVIWPFETR